MAINHWRGLWSSVVRYCTDFKTGGYDIAVQWPALHNVRRRGLWLGSSRFGGELAWAPEPLEDRSLLTLEFHLLALIYKDVRLPNASGTLGQPAIDAIVEGVQLELPTMINQLAGDQIQVRVHVEIVDRPLDQLYWDGTHYQWATDSAIDPELDEFTKSGWYDHVFVFHGLGGDLGPTAWWGGGSLARYGMSIGSINIDPNLTKLGDHWVPGFIHEWIHGLESQYFWARGVSKGNAPDNSSLDLHDAEEFGYTPDTENRPGWSEWYGDFLTDHLRDFTAGGVDTGLGLGPDAWEHGLPRDDVTLTPGSPLEFPDASNTSATFLSDMYWASATTELGSASRDTTVDGNPIAINGAQYDKGVGLPANGQIRVNLRGRSDRFQADLGLADDAPSAAESVIFKVYGDGQLLYTSPALTGADAAVHIDLDVLGVNQLWHEVEDAGDGIAGNHGVWANAMFQPFAGVFLSDVAWASSRAGDRPIHLDKTVDRNEIQINGVTYGKGVGIQANGEIIIPLDGRFGTFVAEVGIDDDVNFWSSVVFEIYADGQLAYSSGLVDSSAPAIHVEVNLAGVQQLRLVVTDGGDGTFSDHAAWGRAYLTPLPKVAVIQTGGSTSVAESGLTDTFTVVLTEQPISDVVLSVTSGAPSEVTVSPATLTFTHLNWNVPQTVTVTAVNDALREGTTASAIVVSVIDELSDPAFHLLVDQKVTVTTSDNDSFTGIALSKNSIAEDLPMGSTVGSFSVTDAGVGDNFTYTLVSGAGGQDNSWFTINGDELLTAGDLNFDTQSSYSILVRTTSQEGVSFDKRFTINVTNVDAPTVISMASSPLEYHTTPRRIIPIDSTATITDPDSANFGGRVLKVSGQVAKDQLSLLAQGGIAKKGNKVQFNRTTIGTLSSGKRGAALAINLNSSSTQPAIQALLRAIGFKSTEKTTPTRILQIRLTSANSSNAVVASRQIQVIP